jgi:hypothetical protein
MAQGAELTRTPLSAAVARDRGDEKWRKLKPGDEVIVRYAVDAVARAVLGRRFVLDRFSKPHGYAVVRDDAGALYVHPGALERVGT